MGNLSLDRMLFDPTDTGDSSNVGAYVRGGLSGAVISRHSGVKAPHAPFSFVDADVNVANDTIAETAHGFNTGDLVQLTTTGTLPAGLALLTDYYVIRVSADLIKLAASDVDAEAGLAVDITAAAGGGTHTVTGFEQNTRSLDVYIANPSMVVSATDLDIRDLTHVSDSVKVGDGTDFLAISAAGEANVVLSSTSGVYAEDSAHVSADKGMFALAVRNDAAATSLTSANGDYSPIAVDEFGRLFVNADFTTTSDFAYAEDSASAGGDILASVGAVRQDTLANSTSSDGDYGNMKLNVRGALWTSPVGTVADDAVDTENPVKVGGKAYTGASALSALSASGDRSDLAMDLYRRVYVNDAPNVAVQSTRVTVGTSAVALPSTALPGRTRMMIQNISSNPVWVGPVGVTTSGSTTGVMIGKGNILVLEAGQGVVYYAIAGSAGNDVVVFEQA